MQDQTKSFINLMTVFISQIPDEAHREQMEHALAKTKALIEGDEDALYHLVPPHRPKHIS
jgi:hypothetical protein